MKVLIKRRASLGDVLNTTPVARRLRLEYPDAIINVATDHPAAYVGNPHVNSGLLPEDQYDRIIDLNMCFESDKRRHQVDCNMLRAFGDISGDKTIVLIHEALGISGLPWDRVVVVHANRSWAQRTLPLSWWNEVLTKLILKNFVPVLTGTPVDWKPNCAVDFIGLLSLREQANLIDRAKVFLSGSSGLVTVAGATETPIVCMVSNAPWENWAPYRHGIIGWNTFPVKTPLPCYGCDVDEPPAEYYPCRRTDLPNACMNSFDSDLIVETVKQAAEQDLRKQG